MKTVVSRFLPLAILIAVVVGWKLYNKSKASEQVRQQAQVLVELFPAYADNKEYYDAAFSKYHGKAFDHAYKMGGRRSSSSFDEDGYLTVLIALVQRDARESGKAQIAEMLEEHRQALGLPIVEFQ